MHAKEDNVSPKIYHLFIIFIYICLLFVYYIKFIYYNLLLSPKISFKNVLIEIHDINLLFA